MGRQGYEYNRDNFTTPIFEVVRGQYKFVISSDRYFDQNLRSLQFYDQLNSRIKLYVDCYKLRSNSLKYRNPIICGALVIQDRARGWGSKPKLDVYGHLEELDFEIYPSYLGYVENNGYSNGMKYIANYVPYEEFEAVFSQEEVITEFLDAYYGYVMKMIYVK